MQADLLAERLFEAALELFNQRGYAAVTLGDIAAAAPCPLEDLYRVYPRKDQFILRLYERLAFDLENHIRELPTGTMAERFRTLVQAKLTLMEPQREMLKYLLPAMLDPDNRLGVLGPGVARIRARVQSLFNVVVQGAGDAPAPAERERLVRMLYTAHLGVVFLALQDQSPGRTLAREALDLAADLTGVATRLLARRQSGLVERVLAPLFGLPRLDQLSQRVDRLVGSFVQPPHDPAHFTQAENLLRELFRHRRLLPGAGPCATQACTQCLALHLPRVEAFVAANEPIQLVLPAFPAKSANPRKVTGPLPDLGEELALRFLQERCQRIRESYAPGARLTICSDGRVFSDLVGVNDAAVTAYRLRLLEMIADLGLSDLSVFDLDDVRPREDYDTTRAWLMAQHGEPLEELLERTNRFEEHRQMFNGIHRFLMEDLVEREPNLSRTQARNRSKYQAYEVIRRSNAWSRLVASYFPGALRLSIHPQPAHAEKIGILLTAASDPWLTPWHGAVLLQTDQFVLTRRAEAEAQGATLIERGGHPSHFEIRSPREVIDVARL